MIIRVLTCLLFLGLVGQSRVAAHSPAQQELTNFGAFRRLSPPVARQGQMVRFTGVVLCSDAGWGQLYVHDGGETRWFSPTSFNTQLREGDLVEITGATILADGVPGLTNLAVFVKGRRPLPAPTSLAIGQFAHDFGQWVETVGEVRVADASWGRLALVIADGGQSCLVFIMGTPLEDSKQWVGSKVRVQGINASKFENGHLKAAWLFAPSLKDVAILQTSRLNPAQVPVASIGSLLNRELDQWTNDIVHVNGIVSSYQPGSSIEVKDPTGSLTAHLVQITRVQQSERVDLWGFLTIAGNEAILTDAYFEPVQHQELKVADALLSPNAVEVSTEPALRRVSDIISLTKQKASTGLPVQLRGIVTFADPDWHNLFFHDETGDVYVESVLPDVRPGQLVELTGRTSRGGFVPEVAATKITVVGTNSLPLPAKVDLEDLANGNLDSHWVELEGVVRRVSAEWGHVNLTIMTRLGRFRVIIPDFGTNPPPVQLIDALVAVQGACSSQLNNRGQLNGITLHVPTLNQIRILESVAADPFSIRTVPIATVATFDPIRLAGRRVKVSGAVTLVLPQRGFIVQDSTGGIRVGTSELAALQLGDTVEALGFPAMDEFSPCLEEAVVRRTGAQPLPRATRKTAEQLLADGTNDMQLVELQAQLVQTVPISARQRLMLQDGPIIFSADLQNFPGERMIPAWKSGAVVRLRGICCIQGNEQHEPEAFRLLLNRASDVSLVSAAPWWTFRQTMLLAGSLGLAIVVALAWIFLLRHQVRAQTRIIHRNQKELLETSRQAGMAEVASAVLHNVGNVLTTVNIGAEIMAGKVKHSSLQSLLKAVDLVEKHQQNLGEFLACDPKGRRLPEFLKAVATQLKEERQELLGELKLLQSNIDHIKNIVIMQQSYARVSGLAECLPAHELLEDAIRMNALGFELDGVRIVRDYSANVPEINVEKHKVLQILVNLLQNAKNACEESRLPDRQVTVGIANGGQGVKFFVVDNGVGIAPENLTRIFNHGFTTRKDGHGFGLHSGAVTAKEMGGALHAFSSGIGSGSRFTLELPISQSKS